MIVKRFSVLAIVLLSTTFMFAQTTISTSFVHNSITRTYRIYIPAIYNGTTAVPLVLNLHGYSSNNIQQEQYGDFRQIADTANFIVVHPNGTLDGSNNQFWNTFNGSTVNDLGFLSALIDTIQANYNIDATSIYSTGMSNGGFMSYDLACYLSNKIAAIASVTGSMIPAHKATCAPTHPMPIMQIHGTADATVPYNGGSFYVHIDSLVKYWVQFNNCGAVPTYSAVPNINTTDGSTADHYVYNGGTNGSTVELYKIISGAHTWPGAPFVIGVTCMDFSASKEIWRFFRKYKLNVLTSVNEMSSPFEFNVYPNPSENNFTLNFQDQSKKQIRVIDCLGQTILNESCLGMQTEIHLEKSGFYFLTVSSGDQYYTKKIIKN